MKIALSGASGSIGVLLKKYLAKKHEISTISLKEKQNIKKKYQFTRMMFLFILHHLMQV